MNNVVEKFKKGSKIHIKESQKGTFTKYCGGNVTSECIQRGKNSPDPKIRKKATFAANARKWKHKDGGKAFVNGVNILDSNPDAYKYVKKKYKMHQEGGNIQKETKTSSWNKIKNGIGNVLNSDWGQFALNGLSQLLSTSSQVNNIQTQGEAQKDNTPTDFWSIINQKVQEKRNDLKQQIDAIKAITGDIVNVNDDLLPNAVWKEASAEYTSQENARKQQNKIIDAQIQAQKNDLYGNLAGNVVSGLAQFIGNKVFNKTPKTTTTNNTKSNKNLTVII